MSPVNNEGHRPIFRLAALQRYSQKSNRSVLPRVFPLRLFLYLWLVLAITLVAGLVVWFPVIVGAFGGKP